MNSADLLFYLLAALSIVCALGVILVPSPIYSALMLALTMVSLSAIFFTLEAYFLAGVQLIVYAGAVVVLFVMVLMLFDLRKEKTPFSGGNLSNGIKFAVVGLSFIMLAVPLFGYLAAPRTEAKLVTTKDLSLHLFTKYIFTFEMIGVLLLVVLVGAMSLAKSKGGTHE
jgi:NADH-quinone oxidoreductase subunit J